MYDVVCNRPGTTRAMCIEFDVSIDRLENLKSLVWANLIFGASLNNS